MGEVDHAFGALNTLLLAMLLGFCIFAAYMIKRYSFYYLPESAAAIIIGCVVGAVISFLSTREEINFLTFDPEIFFFVFLPPIIFEAGYSLRYFLYEFRWHFLQFWFLTPLLSSILAKEKRVFRELLDHITLYCFRNVHFNYLHWVLCVRSRAVGTCKNRHVFSARSSYIWGVTIISGPYGHTIDYGQPWDQVW